ncbi:DUF4365 domain-containing protein [Bacillus cereus]|uniref:DUF4365 domain-containing protein n=1 Tax=Bacillus cereus TaxID=1396 RepID=UPI000C28DFA1|nr:DUF4365 domain-containing protein [Bacillus cereus]
MDEIGRVYGPLYERNPKYKKTSMTDRAGVGIVMNTLAKNDLYFKELTTGDIGIDGIIEPVIEERGSGLLIACQIKSSENSFQSKTQKKFFTYSKLDYSHYEYWLAKCIPVIIILVNTRENVCYWEHVTETKIKKNKKGFSIKVPKHHTLDNEETFKKLYEIALNRNEEDSKYYHLRKEKGLISKVKSFDTKITFTNKDAGEADLELFFNNYSQGTAYFKYDSKTDFLSAVKQYFFWATVTKVMTAGTQITVRLTLNNVGEKFLELEEVLQNVKLEFK